MDIKFTETCRTGGKWAYEEYLKEKLPIFLSLPDLSLLIIKTSEEIRGNKTKFKTKKTYIKSKIKRNVVEIVIIMTQYSFVSFFIFFYSFPFSKSFLFEKGVIEKIVLRMF